MDPSAMELVMHKKEPWEWWLIAGCVLVGLAVLGGAFYSFTRDHWDISVSMNSDQQPEQVFDMLTGPDARVAWQYGVTAVTPLVGEDNAVGSTRFIFMRADRSSWQMEETVLAYDRPLRWHVRQMSDDQTTEIRLEIRETPDGCHLDWHETHSFTHPWDRVLAYFEMRSQKARLQSGLEQAFATLTDQRPL